MWSTVVLIVGFDKLSGPVSALLLVSRGITRLAFAFVDLSLTGGSISLSRLALIRGCVDGPDDISIVLLLFLFNTAFSITCGSARLICSLSRAAAFVFGSGCSTVSRVLEASPGPLESCRFILFHC